MSTDKAATVPRIFYESERVRLSWKKRRNVTTYLLLDETIVREAGGPLQPHTAHPEARLFDPASFLVDEHVKELSRRLSDLEPIDKIKKCHDLINKLTVMDNSNSCLAL